MNGLEDIEAAIVRLAPDDYKRLLDWLREREQSRWDEQMDRDGVTGALDFLFEEAERESAGGLLREWPGDK